MYKLLANLSVIIQQKPDTEPESDYNPVENFSLANEMKRIQKEKERKNREQTQESQCIFIFDPDSVWRTCSFFFKIKRIKPYFFNWSWVVI